MAATKRQAPSKGSTVLEFDTDAIKRREREVAKETDDEIYARLAERFEILDEMTKAVKTGDVRAMIVSGPPGVGKSFGVERQLQKADLFNTLAERKPKFEVVKGAAIFITNIKFEHVKSKRLRDHLDALESRCHYIDLAIDTNREKILRIKQVVKDNDMLGRYEFEDCVKDELVEFVETNQDKLRELSLRMVLKLADLRKSFPRTWMAMAKTTCMKRT